MRVKLIIRITILCLFMMFLYTIIDWNLLKEAVRNVRFLPVCTAIVLYFFNVALRACRWQMILNKHQKRLLFQEAYLITLIGIALNIFIPATLGDIAKSYYGYRMYGIKEEMLSTAIIDKMFAFCALFLIGSISGYSMEHYMLCSVSLFAAILASIPIMFPSIVPWNLLNAILRAGKKSLDTEKLLKAFTLPNGFKLTMIGFSIIGWLLTCIYFYVLCSAFPVTVSLGYVILIMPILMIVRLFPFTVNALGPMEVAVAYFFGIIGITPTLAVLISLSSNIISSIIPGSIGFLIILIWGHKTSANIRNLKLEKKE